MKTNKLKPIKPDSIKDNPEYFEVPVFDADAFKAYKAFLEQQRGITNHTVVSLRSSNGCQMVGLLPDKVKS